MTDHEPLSDRKAIDKIKHIAKGEAAMLCTVGVGTARKTRPMQTQTVDDDGTIWFMSRADSDKNREIAADPHVQLLYALSGKSEYLTVDGTAIVLRDQQKIDELWSSFMKTWFHDGKDDPNLTLIKMTPTSGYYWDTKHGKMVALAGMVVGAITGKETDDSREGTLSP